MLAGQVRRDKSRWVSAPMTASTSSDSMATGRLSFLKARSTSAPAWMGSPEWHICEGSRSRGQASDQANWWARPVPATKRTCLRKGTPKRPDRFRVTSGHRHRAWWSSIQEHRNDTHRSFSCGRPASTPAVPVRSPCGQALGRRFWLRSHRHGGLTPTCHTKGRPGSWGWRRPV